jgi:hypothetical protein
MTYMPQIKYIFASMLNSTTEPQAKRARVN